jgi:hypothetical protein
LILIVYGAGSHRSQVFNLAVAIQESAFDTSVALQSDDVALPIDSFRLDGPGGYRKWGHSGIRRPQESLHEAFLLIVCAPTYNLTTIVDRDCGAGVRVRQGAQILHGAAGPDKRMRSTRDTRLAGDLAEAVDRPCFAVNPVERA